MSEARGFSRDADRPRWIQRELEVAEEEPAAVRVIMSVRGTCSGPGKGGMAGLLPLWTCVVMLSALLTGHASACPALCTCSGTTVDCHGLGLRNMPRNIPRNTERL